MLDPFHAWMQGKATRVENQSLCIPVTTWAATRYCINNRVSPKSKKSVCKRGGALSSFRSVVLADLTHTSDSY